MFLADDLCTNVPVHKECTGIFFDQYISQPFVNKRTANGGPSVDPYISQPFVNKRTANAQ